MSRLFGFFARSAAGTALRSNLSAIAEARLGTPVFSDAVVSLWGPTDERSGSIARGIVAAGSIHNREEIASSLQETARAPDHVLLARAFCQWGARACSQIHGDWAAAMWDPTRRELLLGRDPYGNTSLYYHCSPDLFAFASSLDDLRAIGIAPPVLNELYLAQVLVSWSAFHGPQTVNASINRLPPAHYALVSSHKTGTHCYWNLAEIPQIRLPRRADYVERFTELFDQAVRQRLPDDRRIATTLSGGLDCGSIAVTAAPMLADRGSRLSAYVSTPIADSRAFVGSGLGDEFALAADTAAAGRTIDLHRVDAEHLSPVAAMRQMLDIVKAPEHSAGGLYWMLDLFRTAARDGHDVVLTGQMGNCAASWAGDPTSLPIRRQLSRFGLSHMAKLRLRRMLPWPVERAYRRLHPRERFAASAIHPEFAARLSLAQRQDDDPLAGPYVPARQERLRSLKPGALKTGSFYADLGAATGVRITDPMADPRLVAFCISIPDEIFVDPVTGARRWLIREAMRGRLPESVRRNSAMGRQSSDLVHRLRLHAGEVEQALAEIEAGPGAQVVDVSKMRRIWQRIQVEDSDQSLSLAITNTTRGIMAGLFVNGFGTRY